MADVEIRLVVDNSKIVSDEMKRLVDEIVRKTAGDIEAAAKQSIQAGDKTGKVYHLTNPKRIHQASAPGQAPATDLGTLVNSIQTVDTQRGDGEAEVVVGAEYGLYLEMGTKDIAPRPFLGPAVEAARPKFVYAIKKVTGG